MSEDGEAAKDLGCEYGSQGSVRCKGVWIRELGYCKVYASVDKGARVL